MHYYKYIKDGVVYQYEITNRVINNPFVIEITQLEYEEFLASIPIEEVE